MPKVKNNNHLYIGRAGHLATMSECLIRGWNVAIPEVDIGEDIFVVEDETSKLAKVQVKTATGKEMSYGFKAQFIVPLKQINDESAKGKNMRFVFVTRYNKKWQPYIIMTRNELQDKHFIEHIGSKTKNKELKLTFYYRYDKTIKEKIARIECGTQRGFSKSGFPKPSLNDYIDKWEEIFPIRI